MTGRIDGLPNTVKDLAFSPDGSRLAAVLGVGQGMRLYGRNSAGSWTEVNRDEGYDGDSYGVAFARDGRLATTSDDGRLRLYDPDGRFLHAVETATPRPFGLAFNPEDGRLAVGFDGSPEVRIHDGTTLAELPPPDTGGIDNGNLSSVAWSADGTRLFAAGRLQRGGNRPVFAWDEGGAGERRELPAGLNTVMSLKPLPDGGLLAAAGDPWLGVIGPDGAQRWQQAPQQMDPRDQRHNLAVSADGMVVEFGLRPWGEERIRFDVGALALLPGPAPEGSVRPPRQDGIAVGDWINSTAPTLDGAPLQLERDERSRSFAVDPGGGRFLLGTGWWLNAFDAAGGRLWRKAVPGEVWAVNITADGRLAVAAYGDGTIRWHRMEDGAELLALYPFADGSGRWVLWTPEGYYAAAPGTAEALGSTVSRGWDRPAEFFPVSAFPELHEPEALKHVPSALETHRALGLARVERDRKRVQKAVDSPAPPGQQLHVLTIGINRYDNHEELKLDFAANDATKLAEALLKQEGLYSRVNVERPLIDGEADRRAILDALTRLERRMTPDQGDVAVILFSGHGERVGDDYYLLPADVDASDESGLMDTGLEISTLTRRVERMGKKGKVLVLLDACHSGSVADGAKSALPPDIADVREELAEAGPGVIVLSSSSGREISREDPAWGHGAFTKAVLEALSGQANSGEWLSVTALTGYVVERVRALTDNRQTPTITVPGGRLVEARLFMIAL